jgi:hypothetical protein
MSFDVEAAHEQFTILKTRVEKNLLFQLAERGELLHKFFDSVEASQFATHQLLDAFIKSSFPDYFDWILLGEQIAHTKSVLSEMHILYKGINRMATAEKPPSLKIYQLD